MPEDKKLFGKYNQLIMLGLAFLLTTVLGTQLQQRNWDKQQEEKVKEEAINDAREVYQQVLNHHYDLIAAMYQTMDEYEYLLTNKIALDEIDYKSENTKWSSYQTMKGQYEADYPKYYFIILSTFGIKSRDEYKAIHSKLSWAKGTLDNLYINKPSKADLKKFRNKFTSTNGITGPIAHLNGQMLVSIRGSKVGRFIPENDKGSNEEVIEKTTRFSE